MPDLDQVSPRALYGYGMIQLKNDELISHVDNQEINFNPVDRHYI